MTVPARAERRLRPPAKRRVDVFLERLAQAYSVTAAAAAAGVDRRRFYELRAVDEEFAQAWEQAYDAGTDVVRDEIRRRGLEGWLEPVYQRGEQVGTVRKFSDTLLVLEAKRRDPGYREGVDVSLTAPAVFVLESAFDRPAIEAEVVEAAAIELPGEGL